MKHHLLQLFCVITLILSTSCGPNRSTKSSMLVMVKDVDLPSSSAKGAQFATHTFVDYREGVGGRWYRVEITHPKSGVVNKEISFADLHTRERWGERVRVLSHSDGSGNPNLASDIRAFATHYDDSVYRSYPGPNSNTFVEKMLRDVEGVSAILDHNAIGKENGFYAGKTAGGTGLKLQTPIVGLAIGLKEGIEVSALGLSAGVSIYPISVRIPFLPKIPTWE